LVDFLFCDEVVEFCLGVFIKESLHLVLPQQEIILKRRFFTKIGCTIKSPLLKVVKYVKPFLEMIMTDASTNKLSKILNKNTQT